MPPVSPLDRRAALTRALRRYHARLLRKRDGLREDLAEARRAPEYRAWAETLLAYLKQVPPRAAEAVLPDPAQQGRNLTIPLDPSLSAHANAARYFKRAAKAERGIAKVPPRLSQVEAEAHALEVLLDRVRALEEGSSDTARPDDPALDRDLETALSRVPPAIARNLGVAPSRPVAREGGRHAVATSARGQERIPARLIPRRLRTREGWEVWIGRSNEGNDHLTHRLARPEDFWFHVHGAAGSHVVLRRGKSKDEPSRKTLEEVSAWAAFYSQARTAGKVPVIVTRKKYVRKPRKGPPGLALCTNEKTIIVRPAEPPPEALADHAFAADEPGDSLS